MDSAHKPSPSTERDMSSINNRKPILIAGAGLASLLLAQSLRRASIPFIIFERDKSPVFRAQGYRLRLSAEGIDAIESVLEPELFQKFWDLCGKTGGGDLAALDAVTGEPLTQPETKAGPSKTDEKPSGPREALVSRGGQVIGISRGDMRKVFMTGFEDSIQWSHSVTSYRVTPSGVHAVFADGTESDEGDMLVAGDGIYSKVAKQVSGGLIKIYDTGASGIHGQAPTSAFKGLGEGVWRIVDDSRPDGRVFIITNVRSGDKDDPNIQFGWTMGAQPGIIRPPNNDYAVVGKQAADIAKELTKNWHPRFKALFDDMNDSEAAFWKITCSTPGGVPVWPNEPRVTVIGDAVHGMTPAGGIGANTAVRDSALLGRLLGEAGGYQAEITGKYEQTMRVYASEAVGKSYGMATGQFGVVIDENSPTVG